MNLSRTSIFALLACSYACGGSPGTTMDPIVTVVIDASDASPYTTTPDSGHDTVQADSGNATNDSGIDATPDATTDLTEDSGDGGTPIPVQDSGTPTADAADTGHGYYCTLCEQITDVGGILGCAAYNTQPCDKINLNGNGLPPTVLTPLGENDAGLPYILCNLYTDTIPGSIPRTSCTPIPMVIVGSIGGITGLTTTSIPTSPMVCNGLGTSKMVCL